MNTKSILSSDAFWTVNKKLVRILKDIPTVVLLTYLIDKEDYHKNREELIEVDGEFYFFAVSKMIEEITTLSYKQQKRCLGILKKFDLIGEVLIGLPARLHFKINHQKIHDLIFLVVDRTEKLDVTKRESKYLPKVNHSIAQTEKLDITKGDVIERKDLLRKENKEKNINKDCTLFPLSKIE